VLSDEPSIYCAQKDGENPYITYLLSSGDNKKNLNYFDLLLKETDHDKYLQIKNQIELYK